jgi:N-acetylglucosamine kinase-like BadF-type ATPase
VNTFLGVDGGGTKTEFVLVREDGRILARHQEGSAYYLEIGLDSLRAMLARGIEVTLGQASLSASELTFSFFGLPAYGEDSGLLGQLDSAASPTLTQERYRCGNDMVCAWAGALACKDGINIVAGTGSIAYGELAGRRARAGGWGELFSDEGSAHWIAREALNLFSRMSDGRSARGPLYRVLRDHFKLSVDLDLCAAIYGRDPAARSQVAQLAPLVTEAARQGDTQARNLFITGAQELASLVEAVRAGLSCPAEVLLPVSYTGSMFKLSDLVVEPFVATLRAGTHGYEIVAPTLAPAAGAALYAAKTFGSPLTESAVAALRARMT